MCPIIRWSGRTARPSTCQVRSIVSRRYGSVNRPCLAKRLDHPGELGGRRHVRADHTARDERGRDRVEHSHGASMSRTTRSTSLTSSDSTRSPTASRHAGCGSPKKRSTFVWAHGREVGPAFVRHHLTGVADRAQQRAGQRARAGAGLDDPGAGEHVGHPRRSAPRPSGRRPRRRAASTARSRSAAAAARGTACPPVDVTTTPSGRADQLVVLERALVGVERLARLQGERVEPALGVGQLHLVPRAERARCGASPLWSRAEA